MNVEYNSNREKTISFTVPDNIEKIDVRTFLRRNCKLSSRTLSKLKRTELGITLNGSLLKTTDFVSGGDIVVLSMPDDINNITPVKGEIDILFEDDYILVVNKPSNMAVHPTKVHQLDTLANIVVYYMNSKNEHYTFRAVNRLDRDTSGCVLIAKDRFCAAVLPKTVEKEYIAACEGEINKSGTIDKPIKVMPGRSIRRIVDDSGAKCITHYYPIMFKNGHTLTRLILETGRTHQIRCHLSSIGHPLAGDDMYSGSLDYISRQALHCKKISFEHPITGKYLRVEAPLPNDIKSIFDLPTLS